MNKNLTEIVFILDRSGSMHGLEADTIGGYNAFIENQRRLPGEAYLSTVLFDTRIDVLHDRVPLEKVAPLTDRDYVTGGCTALLDAVGGALHHIGNVHKYAREEDRPAKTLIVITTDGFENASRVYSQAKVRQMIERARSKYGWEFIFLGANMDAAQEAEKYGISRDSAMDFRPTGTGVTANFDAVNMATRHLRSTGDLGDDWRTLIDEENQREQ